MRLPLISLILALLAGCTLAPDRSPLAEWRASANSNPRQPRLVVIHHTEMASADEALALLRDQRGTGRVSAHYLIGRDGRIFQLVSESQRAWHAGVSRWGGADDINSRSIGIELDNDGVSAYPAVQIDALLRLLEDIAYRNKLDRSQVVGHGDVAPGRKVDPSTAFPWQTLAEHGFGIWPHADLAPPPAGFDPLLALRVIGYDVSDARIATRAFTRHFRGHERDALTSDDLAALYDLMQQLIAPAAPRPTEAPR